MADGLLVERLRQYLRDLKPEARALLIAELERGLLRGDETAGAELVLQELRRSAREPSRPSSRTGSLARLFFQPLEPFLVDDTASHSHPGRIARVALDPIWQWICRDLLPGEAKAVTDEVARAFASDDTAKAEELARAFQDRTIQRMQEALDSAQGDDKARRKLAGQIGTPRALEDVGAILNVLRARDALTSLGARLPGHIKNLADVQLDEVKALLDLPQISAPSMFLSALVLVMSRLAAPWQLVRLATKAAASDSATRVSETHYAIAVAIVLAEIERMVGELKTELRSGRGVATGALLKGIHDAARGMRTEINLSTDSPWGKQLAALRTEISNLLKAEIESLPGRVRRLLRPRPAKEIAANAMLDDGDVAETETLIEFVGICRNYAGELAVSEMTQRAYSEVHHYLDTSTQSLIEAVRQAGDHDRTFRKSQLDAAARFCAKMFGQEYADLLTKAASMPANSERKAANGKA
jgi:hypothetical protein